MLDLDSDRWRQLRHAYGAAADIPQLLRQLHVAPVRSRQSNQQPWSGLWSALCHQSTVYPASYAAVPHIIAAAALREPAYRAEYLVLAGTIESLRHKASSPVLSGDLESGYAEALQAAVPLALEALRAESDPTWFRGVVAAVATFCGHPELGSAISELQREIDCPNCGESFVAPGYEELE
jgi:hypothetical protein